MITVKNLKKRFGELEVLKGIDMSVNDGEVVVIIGPSGTGKSTFLRCMNLIEKPDEGQIQIDEAFVDAQKYSSEEERVLRSKTSMVFQSYSLFKNKTILQNVMMPYTVVQKVGRKKAEEEALKLLEKVGLVDKKDEYPSRLSGGQQQRAGIARAMAVNPSVILFDEPTSSLDPELVGDVMELITKLAQEHNRTMLIVTHEMRFAKEVADRIIFMDGGKIVEDGKPEEVFSNPKNERTRKFLEQIDY